MKWSCPLAWQGDNTYRGQIWRQSGKVEEGSERQGEIVNKVLEEASEAQTGRSIESRWRERPRPNDERLEPLDDCQSNQHRLRAVRRKEAPE